jgi:hypothetical protein
MRHAREIPTQRRGGDSTGSAWPSIVATTTSLTGAAAGLATLAVWQDTFHLRIGVGMAAAGAVYSSVAMLGRWRDKTSRREALAEARADSVAEMRFEIGRREGQIATLKLRVREAEETVVLFEQRALAEQARADAADSARIRVEHDLAVLSAWVHQTRAAAELTRSAVQSFQTVQPFEPAATASSAYATGNSAYATASTASTASATQSSALQYAEYDLAPAAAVPMVPANDQTVRTHRPLRSAVLAERASVGFDVASDISSAPEDPYLVPGVAMPRHRAEHERTAGSPSRPIAPERLYRPYLSSSDGSVEVAPGAVDLTAFDDTAQFSAVDHGKGRKSG